MSTNKYAWLFVRRIIHGNLEMPKMRHVNLEREQAAGVELPERRPPPLDFGRRWRHPVHLAVLKMRLQRQRLKPPAQPHLPTRRELQLAAHTLRWRAMKSLAELNEAIEREPANPEHYDRRAGVYDDAENYEAALDDLYKAVELSDYKNGTFFYHLGIVYCHAGCASYALEDLNEAIRLGVIVNQLDKTQQKR
jgi:tetratricopeptide (TPR) repeat protein